MTRKALLKPLAVPFCVLLILLLCAAPTVAAAETFDSAWAGLGTESQPYLITSANDLKLLADKVNAGNSYENTFFRVSNDINMGSVCDEWNGTWTPIGYWKSPFMGTFDGYGHILSDLYIDDVNSSLGLFGETTNAVIKNLGLEGVWITGTDTKRVGSIVGSNSARNGGKSIITNCYVTGNISSDSSGYVGGLIGENSVLGNGEIVVTDCFSKCAVRGDYYVGGITGSNFVDTGSITINNCHSSGVFISGNDSVGGIAGRNIPNSNPSSATISNCVVLNLNIDGSENVGRIIGDNRGTSTNNYAVNTLDCADDGIGVSRESTWAKSFYEGLGWDFENVWIEMMTVEHPLLRVFYEKPDEIGSDYKLRVCTIESGELVSIIGSSAPADSMFVFAVDKADSENKYKYIKVSIRYPDNKVYSSFGTKIELYPYYPYSNELTYNIYYSECSKYLVVCSKSERIEPGVYTAWLIDGDSGTQISKEVSFTITNSQSSGLVGQGTKSSPYLIQSADDLIKLSRDFASYDGLYFSQTRDIDLYHTEILPIGCAPYINITDPDSLNENDNRILIYGNGVSFNGIYNGNGYTISNLNFNENLDWLMLYSGLGDKALGLFCNLGDGAILKNINLENVNIQHNNVNVAGLVGQIWGGLTNGSILIENCSVSGTINTEYRGGLLAGTIYAPDGSVVIRNCTVNGVVESGSTDIGRGGYRGGFSGYLGGNVDVMNCCVNATVFSDGGSVGGFVGFCTGGNFSDCIVSGTVSNTGNSEGDSAGGMTGEGIPYSIDHCIIAVDTISSNIEAGGIIGCDSWFTSDQSIQNVVILSSSITGRNSSAIAGSDGWLPDTKTSENVYILDSTQIVGDKTSDEDITRKITQSEAKTQRFYEGLGFNFDTTWEMSSVTGYPVLKKVQLSPGDDDDTTVEIVLGSNMVAQNPAMLNQAISKGRAITPISIDAKQYYYFDKSNYQDADGLNYSVSSDKKVLTITGVPNGDIIKTLAGATESPKYTITVSTNGNGTATASQNSAKMDSQITLTATPNKGYAFSKWQVVSGDIQIKDNTFIMPFGDVSIRAIFLPEYLVPVEDTTESVSAATAAEVGYKVTPVNIQEIKAPSITHGGRSLVLDEKVVVKVTKNGVESEVPATVKADGTVDVADADIAGADSVSVTFVGRKIGDTIGNGNVNVNSNIKIARFLVGLADMTYADQFYGDISADGKLEVNDNIMLARYLAGILDENFEVK